MFVYDKHSKNMKVYIFIYFEKAWVDITDKWLAWQQGKACSKMRTASLYSHISKCSLDEEYKFGESLHCLLTGEGDLDSLGCMTSCDLVVPAGHDVGRGSY